MIQPQYLENETRIYAPMMITHQGGPILTRGNSTRGLIKVSLNQAESDRNLTSSGSSINLLNSV